RHIYPEVGRCIYCGSAENLSDEHIVPYGLGGNLELPKSSCKRCARITSKFELAVLRGSMRPVRIYRKIQSRGKHQDSPVKYLVTIESGGDRKDIKVPIEDYPILVTFPIFAVPGYLLDIQKSKGINVTGHAIISFGCKPADTLRKYNGARLIIMPTVDTPVDFARMIAKIAFSMAVATGAFEDEDYSKSFVLPAILGEKDDIGKWVGTITVPITSAKYHLHRVLVYRDIDKGLLVGDVQIFSDSETPRYGVILGKLKKKYNNEN
ncbi:MAG: HNH endonuclease, partial [Syntrophorhabdus sp.]